MTGKDTWKVIATTAFLSVAATKCVEVAWKNYKLQQSADKKKSNDKVIAIDRKYDDHLYREQLARNFAF